MILKATSQKLWEGLEVCNNGFKISHLQYAYDTFIFCPQNLEYLLNIKKVLVLFQFALGLQVNFHKSMLISINIPISWLEFAASSLLCKSASLHYTNLGLLIGIQDGKETLFVERQIDVNWW